VVRKVNQYGDEPNQRCQQPHAATWPLSTAHDDRTQGKLSRNKGAGIRTVQRVQMNASPVMEFNPCSSGNAHHMREPATRQSEAPNAFNQGKLAAWPFRRVDHTSIVVD
jgi:hypothetical protein